MINLKKINFISFDIQKLGTHELIKESEAALLDKSNPDIYKAV